ncbi:hypothetical protein PAMC26510_31965 [Caballeronia sordidicola]|uniref:Uncharacterized protein n=1 Tax=Caballeronia sordidicola TaxID=196367 RepID=A0A242M8Q0_CABSO|nr:hypothetical protein PAMC26510_31965 [Caballeronia sordidicola]
MPSRDYLLFELIRPASCNARSRPLHTQAAMNSFHFWTM